MVQTCPGGEWIINHNISRESDGDFYQCSLQLNLWSTQHLHNDSAVRFPFLQTPKNKWINRRRPAGESTEERWLKKRQCSPPSHPMQNSHKNPTHIYFCRRNKDMESKDKSYTMVEYFRCYGQFTNDVKYFVPIT